MNAMLGFLNSLRQRIPPRRLLLGAIDALLIGISLTLAYLLRFDFSIPIEPDDYRLQLKNFLPWVILFQIALFCGFQLYRGLLRYASMNELFTILAATTTGAVTLAVANEIIHSLPELGYLPVTGWGTADQHVLRIPRSILIIYWLLAVMTVGGFRFSRRLWIATGQRFEADARRILIVGAGDLGESIARMMLADAPAGLRPVAFATRHAEKVAARIHGLPVLGRLEDIGKLIAQEKIDEVVVALESAQPAELRRIVRECESAAVKVNITPSLEDVMAGKVSVSALRPVGIEDLLTREPVRMELPAGKNYLKGERILVTGAGGSIGGELCRQILSCGPELLVLLGKGENSVYELYQDLRMRGSATRLELVVGDVRDAEKMASVFQRHKPTLVFHAAAHKHVPLMEAEPEECVKNNVIGTAITAHFAHRHEVKKFILVSTDKAVRPSSIMGASKRVAEQIVFSLAAQSKTAFCAVRFGNVLGSRGSVIPLFKRQIEQGGPVTVTHPDVTRYFMTIPEAVSLILQAGAREATGQLYVLDMGEAIRIQDLARNLITLSGLKPDVDIKIQYVGLRPGEKLKEELLTRGEGITRTELGKIFNARPDSVPDWKEMAERVARLEEAATQGDGERVRSLLAAMVPDNELPGTNAALVEEVRGLLGARKESKPDKESKTEAAPSSATATAVPESPLKFISEPEIPFESLASDALRPESLPEAVQGQPAEGDSASVPPQEKSLDAVFDEILPSTPKSDPPALPPLSKRSGGYSERKSLWDLDEDEDITPITFPQFPKTDFPRPVREKPDEEPEPTPENDLSTEATQKVGAQEPIEYGQTDELQPPAEAEPPAEPEPSPAAAPPAEAFLGEPDFLILLPIYDPTDPIEPVLEALAGQSNPRYRLEIVDCTVETLPPAAWQERVARDPRILFRRGEYLNTAQLFNSALDAPAECPYLLVLPPRVYPEPECLEQMALAFEDPSVARVYSDYLRLTPQGRTEEVHLLDWTPGVIHERHDFGFVSAYRMEVLRALDGVREDLTFAAEYDLLLRMTDAYGCARIGQALYLAEEKGVSAAARREAPDTARLRVPGEPLLGGYSYLFYPPAMEEEITSVFEQALPRRGLFLDHPTRPVPTSPFNPRECAVTVLIPARDPARHLANAIQKVLHGTFQDFEVLVVTWNRAEAVAEVVNSFVARDRRVRLIALEGVTRCAALNQALRQARGRHIVLLEGEDELVPHCLKTLVGYLQTHPTWGMAVSHYELIDEEGIPIPELDAVTHAGSTRNQLLRHDGIGAVRAIPRTVLEELKLYNEEFDDAGGEYDLALRLTEDFEVGRIAEVLYRYRRRSRREGTAGSDARQRALARNRARELAMHRRRAINASLGKLHPGLPPLLPERD